MSGQNQNLSEPSVLSLLLKGQDENTKAIKSLDTSMSKLANMFTEFLVESKHTNKDLSELRHVIYGEDGILDQVNELKTDRKIFESKKKFYLWIATPVVSILTGAMLTIATQKLIEFIGKII